MQELLDFISKECQIKLGENLHWARREQLLGIEDAAEKAGCSAEDIVGVVAITAVQAQAEEAL